MLKSTHRIISGVDNNQSKIISEDEVKPFSPYDIFPCFQIENLFYTEDKSPSLNTRHLNKPYDINLPEGAFRFMRLRMPTKKEMEADLIKAGQPLPTDWKTFNLHNTDSIDYIFVLSGEIDYVVDGKITRLKTGDFLAQIGPEHTWINDSDIPCIILCVMIGIKSNNERKKMSVE